MRLESHTVEIPVWLGYIIADTTRSKLDRSLTLPPEAFSNPSASLLPRFHDPLPTPSVIRIHWPLSHLLASLQHVFYPTTRAVKLRVPGSNWQPLGSSKESGWEGLSWFMSCPLLVSPASLWDIPIPLYPSLLLLPLNCL